MVLAPMGQSEQDKGGGTLKSEPRKQAVQDPLWMGAVEGLLTLRECISGQTSSQDGSSYGSCGLKRRPERHHFMAGPNNKRATRGQLVKGADLPADDEGNYGTSPTSKLTRLGWWW